MRSNFEDLNAIILKLKMVRSLNKQFSGYFVLKIPIQK
jgi:hypothetical protein